MKNSLKRLTAMVTVLCTCAGLVFTAAAVPSKEELEQAVTPITLSAAATEQSNGSYLVQYEADLTMSAGFAQAVVALNTSDYLKKLQFTCILEDELVEQLDLTDVAFTFAGAAAANFEPNGDNYIAKGPNGELLIRYKLNAAVVDDWRYMRADQIEASLMQKMTMHSARKTVSSAVMDKAKGSDGKVLTTARVEVTYADGNIPIYDEPSILAAESKQIAMTIYTYDDDDGEEDVTPSKPNYKVEVEKPADSKGTVTPDVPRAPEDKVVTITVTPDDGFRLTGLVINDANGRQIPVTKNDDGTFSFEMPTSNVSIIPTFALSAALPEDSGVSSTLNTTDHIAFMIGDDTGRFRPNASITRAEVAQIFYALLKDKNVPITVSFDDVDGDAWYAKAVNTLASLGAVKGVGDGKFAPERLITRAEFATIAANFAEKASNPFDFNDVSKNHWAYPYISATAAYGWVAGVGNNNFEPDRGIMRAEAATIVNNMLGRMGDKAKIDAGLGRTFPDVDKSHWGWYEIGEASFSHKATFNDSFTKEFWAD